MNAGRWSHSVIRGPSGRAASTSACPKAFAPHTTRCAGRMRDSTNRSIVEAPAGRRRVPVRASRSMAATWALPASSVSGGAGS
uniref:hypothetical protein n=1 Tax=Brachybacterium sp. GPGPB12 TaxID=3023517 RepID=UPI00404A79AD